MKTDKSIPVAAVAFTLDTTGSMSYCLADLRKKLSALAIDMQAHIPNLQIAVITHGDYCDLEKAITYIDFTSNIDDVVKFINSAPATSGGDAPECYEYALRVANNLSWPFNGGTLVVIGDEQPHGPDDVQNMQNLDWQQEVQSLLDKRVRTVPLHCHLRDDNQIISFYQGIADIASTPYLSLTKYDETAATIAVIAAAGSGSSVLKHYTDVMKSNGYLSKAVIANLKGLEKYAKTRDKDNKMKTQIENNDTTPVIHNVLLVDRSGSMSSYVGITRQNVNELFRTVKSTAKKLNQKVQTTLVGFDDVGEVLPDFDAVSLDKLGKVDQRHIFARGGTRLYKTITQVIKSMYPKVRQGDAVVFSIFTDGCDTFGGLEEAQAAISEISNSNWTIVYVGPTHNAATLLGIPDSNTIAYQVSSNGMRGAFYRLTQSMRSYLEKKAANPDATLWDNFSSDKGVDPKLSEMTIKDMKLNINMPDAWDGDDGEENMLPPYAPIPAYVVDEYPACPDTWMHGSARAASYFVPVKKDHGMWFDFNGCDTAKRDVAVVISVQGVNPVNGQKTSTLRLEQYATKCPIHDVEFQQDRFCSTCGYKWPAQNYLSSAATPTGKLWLDGFLTPEGKVRQYIFTEEVARGVANGIIGPQETVYAIGVAFYRSKKERPQYTNPMFFSPLHTPHNWSSISGFSGFSGYSGCAGTSGYSGASGYARDKSSIAHIRSLRGAVPDAIEEMELSLNAVARSDVTIVTHHAFDMGEKFTSVKVADYEAVRASLAPKNYEVGAGTKLDQRVYEDTNTLDHYEDEPIGMIYVSYSDEETVKTIVTAGKREEVMEGFLAGIPVGI